MEIFRLVMWIIILLGVIAISTIICYTDFKRREIPNWLNLTLAGLGVAKILVMWDLYAMINSLIACGVFLLVGIVIQAVNKESFGGGDVKLVAASGLLMPVMQEILLYAIIMFVISLAVFIYSKIKGIRSSAGGPILVVSLVGAIAVSTYLELTQVCPNMLENNPAGYNAMTIVLAIVGSLLMIGGALGTYFYLKNKGQVYQDNIEK